MRAVAFAIGSGLALLGATTPVTAQSFTVSDIMTAPFASDLAAAPAGGAFAWVRYDRGTRNIWVAEAPAYTGRQLTSWSADDGQDVLDLSFTTDGRNVVFVRGGGPNRQGEIPNPTSAPEPAERGIWIQSLEGGAPRLLAEGAAPEISPDGRTLAFLRRGQIFTVPLDEEGAEAGQLLRIRGTAGSLSWSPGGDRIAFVSNRGGHAFVGVFDPETREVLYLDPSLDRDGSPVWAADGSRIAFLRIPNEGQRLPFSPVRAGLPWSIRVADARTGDSQQVWAAEEGRGSAFHGISGPQLIWTDDDLLVFPWERDGWSHLYAVASGGGTARLLTPGSFEVEDVRRGPDGRTIYFSSNQGDIDRRHLWRVTASGGPPERLTPGDGIEWSPTVGADGAVAFLASDARTPAHAEILEGGSARRPMVSGFMPAGFPRGRLVQPEQVVFTADDGVEIHGQLFLPPEVSGAPRPAAIFFHGGSRRQMLLGWHYLRYYHNTYALNQYLASRGYVVLSVNYRSGIGYGLEFREALDYGARGASEYRDVVAAGRFLAARDDVDAERIGLWGGSYGGYLTALGLARNSDMFAAGVDIHGVHDWNVVIRNFVPAYQAGAREDFARLAYESSPMSAIDGWRSPVLLIHGDDDRNVPFSESVDLIEALRKRDVPVEQLVFPDEVHGFLLHRNWLAAFEAAASFFDRKLFDSMTTDEGS